MPRLVAAFAACLAIVLLAPLSPCLAIEPRDIPTPRPAGWVADGANILPAATEERLNRLCDEVHRSTGAELAVVTVRTIAGRDPRRFATDLFNHWGVGSATQNNGLLVFVAIDDRAAEIILGDGIDQTSNVRTAEDVMQNVMVPRFRGGDPAGAIEHGTAAAAERILKFRRAAATPPQPQTQAPRPQALPRSLPRELPPVEAEGPVAMPRTESLPPVEAAQPPPPSSAAPAPTPRLPPSTYRSTSGSGIGTILFTGVLGLGAIVAGGTGGVMLIRRLTAPPVCPSCGQPMIPLDEAADDAHLTASERTEERVGSVDHVVWYCVRDNRVIKTSHSRWFSGYSRCPSCNAKTLDGESTVLYAATYDDTGLMRYDERCAHCGYTHSDTRIIPRKTRPVAHTSSFSSGRSSGSSSRSSGFGGGRSSGRGASGRW